MRIIHICLCGTYTDGLGYQENYLAKYHRKSGNDVFLIANEWAFDNEGKRIQSCDTDYTNADGVHVFRLKCKPGKVANTLRVYPEISNLVKELQPDILFIHGCAFWSIHKLAAYLKKHNVVRVYVDNHADYSNSATNWLSKNILHRIIWRSCAKAIESYTRKFYGVLPARVDFLTELYGLRSKKCELLVMGADDDAVEAAAKPEVKAAIREKYGIAADDFLVMTGGKIDMFKTQTLLLMEAARKIQNPKVRLIVFGSLVPELKKKALSLVDELVKEWPGTHHVDLGGNVRYLTQDTAEEIQGEIAWLVDNPEEYEKMKAVAEEKGKQVFSYKKISRRSIGE